KVMRLYSERREAFATMLTGQFAGKINFTVPDGGLAFWVHFDMDLDKLAASAAKHGVILLPASAFTTAPRSIDAARLGFASMDIAELRRATSRLKAAI